MSCANHTRYDQRNAEATDAGIAIEFHQDIIHVTLDSGVWTCSCAIQFLGSVGVFRFRCADSSAAAVKLLCLHCSNARAGFRKRNAVSRQRRLPLCLRGLEYSWYLSCLSVDALLLAVYYLPDIDPSRKPSISLSSHNDLSSITTQVSTYILHKTERPRQPLTIIPASNIINRSLNTVITPTHTLL